MTSKPSVALGVRGKKHTRESNGTNDIERRAIMASTGIHLDIIGRDQGVGNAATTCLTERGSFQTSW